MRATGQVKPSKPLSTLGLIVGIVFIGIGFFIAIPFAGVFGVFWTFIALAITGYHAINLFTEKGVASQIVEFDATTQTQDRTSSDAMLEQRLLRLEELKQKKLINDAEYAEQRKRILEEL